MTTLDNALIFYEQVLGKEEVQRCKELALKTITYREAADRGTDYITLLTNTTLEYCFKSYKGVIIK